jgi:ubiquinol-cytochrome c reductase iron-sulfur subunit
MSDMEETEGTEGPGVPVVPHRVIGTPPPSPRLLGSTAVAEHREPATAAGEDEEEVVGVPHNVGLPPDDPKMVLHGKRAERVVAACFTLAFFTGCAFIAAYVGIGVGTVDKTLRSNLGLGTTLAATLLLLGAGALIWVRHLMPNVELTEERHELRSDDADRQAFQEVFKEGTGYSQFVKRPLIRRTLMLGTLPLLAAPIVLLRDTGPKPGTSLRNTVWSPGRRLLVYGTNQPITPADFSTPGSMISIVPDGYEDDDDALTKAAVILIRFRPGELDVPTRTQGGTLVGTMNWTVDNIVAYSKICTWVARWRCMSRPRTTSCARATSPPSTRPRAPRSSSARPPGRCRSCR